MTPRQSQTPSQKGRAPKVSPSKATPDATPRDTPRRPTKGPGARAEAAPLTAARVLVGQLEDPDPAVAAAAAKTILHRSGLPRVEVVHTEAEPLDLSGLTAEELDTFEALLSRVKGGAS